MPNTYDVGDRVRLTAVFTDPNNGDATVDPTTVKVHYKTALGAVITKTHGAGPEVVKDSVGTYHIDVDLDQDGKWFYRWEGEGAAVAAEENELFVRLRQVVPAA